jgi:hypothetical protein
LSTSSQYRSSSLFVGISLKYWEELKPTEIELERGLLTQLGGVIVFNPQNRIQYKWLDDGICHVCDFDDLLSYMEDCSMMMMMILMMMKIRIYIEIEIIMTISCNLMVNYCVMSSF